MPTITSGPLGYGSILYATANANVRDGPGTGYKAVASLKTGQQVTTISSVVSDGDLWVLVAPAQWVSGTLLADKPPAASGGGTGTPPPPYTPPADSGSMGTVVAALAAAAAGFIAYKWASKRRK